MANSMIGMSVSIGAIATWSPERSPCRRVSPITRTVSGPGEKPAASPSRVPLAK